MQKSWVPPGTKFTSPDNFPSYQEVYPDSVVADLSRKFDIPPDKLDRFRYFLELARNFFYSQHIAKAQDPGFDADKAAVKRVKRYLQDALNELRRPEMWRRLNAANARLYPSRDGGGFDPDRHWWLMALKIEDLLPIIEEAKAIDGRTLKGERQKRHDARAAAVPLRYFWEDELDKPGAVYKWGDASPCLNFLLACLRKLDPTITESVLRDLDADEGF